MNGCVKQCVEHMRVACASGNASSTSTYVTNERYLRKRSLTLGVKVHLSYRAREEMIFSEVVRDALQGDRQHAQSKRRHLTMSKPKGLDLCCCAGGASMGYHRGGFDMYGSDIDPQKNYPFAFHQGDSIAVLTALNLGLSVAFTHKDGYREHLFLRDFAFIHISPPCQRFTQMAACRPGLADTYPDLVGPARELLNQTGLPYIIENVPGSPVRPDVTLCGHMFGLALYRHRIFESNVSLAQPQHIPHTLPASKAGHWKPGTIMSVSGHMSPIALAREVMGIDWTNRHELAESIPPAYTQELGGQLLKIINQEIAA